MSTFSVTSCLIFFTVIHISLNLVYCNEDVVSVRLNVGVINGKLETTSESKKINVFKGIPYAEPPIGDLRFKKPQPLKEQPKTVEALEWPNSCYQSKVWSFVINMYYNPNLSEDCLYLNIMSPEDSLTSDRLRPVIFYIHGGGLALGAGGWVVNDMKELTARGDVVTVSINYRLGPFGFLYSGTDDAPGNAGLWDQALALEWVNDNIRYFGGDPKRITIMGVSSGGWSVSLHVLSPVTRNLFQNAYFQSGAYVNRMIDREGNNHIELWLKGTELIGCNDEKISDKFTPEIIECLRSTDSDTLSTMLDKHEITVRTAHFPWVVVDGHFLPDKPTQMLKSGNFKRDVNVLFSTASDEGSFMVTMLLPDFSVAHNFTYDEAYQHLEDMFEKLSAKINSEHVAKVYYSPISGSTDPGLFKRTLGIAVGDFMGGCPPILFAKEMFRNNDFKGNVYQYYWNRNVDAKRAVFPMPGWAGPQHGGDATPVHGLPFIDQDNYPDEERRRSEQMMRMVIEFVRTGKPTPEGGEEWPKYYAIDDNIIAPFYEFTSSPKSDTNFGLGLKINECEYLWQKYLM